MEVEKFNLLSEVETKSSELLSRSLSEVETIDLDDISARISEI